MLGQCRLVAAHLVCLAAQMERNFKKVLLNVFVAGRPGSKNGKSMFGGGRRIGIGLLGGIIPDRFLYPFHGLLVAILAIGGFRGRFVTH
jgi:hypothetical protein